MHHKESTLPQLKGSVRLDIKTGLFKCRLRLTKLPKIKGYRILLHKGMNIKFFKDAQGQLINYTGYYDGKAHHVGLEYQFIDPHSQPIDELPASFEVEYVGAFPVYENEYNSIDFKGYIANNGTTLRATEQSKWYPVIYDVTGDRYLDQYSYDLEIEVVHGDAIFINGAVPQKGRKNRFQSTKAVPLFLFAGTFEYISIAGNYIINALISEEKAQDLIRELEEIKSIYASNLGIAYTDAIYLINHEPVDQMPEESHWGFNVYPAFGFAGIDFNELMAERGGLKDPYVELFGHELAHNYFLTNVMSGKLFWFWLESCADYLSFDVVEKKCGQIYLTKKLKKYLTEIEKEEFIPLEKIERPQQITMKYRYYLGPLLWKCFELQFGLQKTYRVLAALLDVSEKRTLTIEEWGKACGQHEISREAFDDFRKEYLSMPGFKEKILEKIKRFCG